MKKIMILTSSVVIVLFSVFFSTVGFAESYNSFGSVDFIPGSDPSEPVNPDEPDSNHPVSPIDPTNPDGKPTPGTSGPLSIDFVSGIDFGRNEISNKDKIYYARAQKYQHNDDTANYVQITDKRGTNSGWRLTVRQDGQFKATKSTTNNVLTHAQMSFLNPTIKSKSIDTVAPIGNDVLKLNPSGDEVNVMHAKQGSGSGTWVNAWGRVEKIKEIDENGLSQMNSVTKDVTLEIPGATPKDAVQYVTTLVWTLSDVPN